MILVLGVKRDDLCEVFDLFWSGDLVDLRLVPLGPVILGVGIVGEQRPRDVELFCLVEDSALAQDEEPALGPGVALPGGDLECGDVVDHPRELLLGILVAGLGLQLDGDEFLQHGLLTFRELQGDLVGDLSPDELPVAVVAR